MPVYILHGIANPWLEQNDPPRPKNTAMAAHSVSYFESQNGPAAQPDRAAVPDLSRRFVVDKRLDARSLRAKSEPKNFHSCGPRRVHAGVPVRLDERTLTVLS
jgi:hypothetical protein